MTDRPTDEFSDPRADDDGAPVSVSSAASGRGRRWEEPEDGNGELDGDDSDLGPLADRPSASRPQRRRRPLLGIAGLAVLVLATGAVLHTQESERRTPEAAVLEYVQLIEAGDIEAATVLVPVLRQPEEADPDESAPPVLDGGGRRPPVVALERLENAALLTNDFYADNPGLTVVSVEVAETPADPGVGESVDVAVDYTVEDSATSAVLRVEREPDSILGLPVWRIRDALTVPFVVSMRDGGLGSAYVDGARVAVSGEMSLPLYSSMLYPGVYTISFDGGTYLQAADLERRVTSPRSIVDPATAHAAATLNVVRPRRRTRRSCRRSPTSCNGARRRPRASSCAPSPTARGRPQAVPRRSGYRRPRSASGSAATGRGPRRCR